LKQLPEDKKKNRKVKKNKWL